MPLFFSSRYSTTRKNAGFFLVARKGRGFTQGMDSYVHDRSKSAPLTQSTRKKPAFFQQSAMLTASPPREVSLYLLCMSRPVSAMARKAMSRVTRWRAASSMLATRQAL